LCYSIAMKESLFVGILLASVVIQPVQKQQAHPNSGENQKQSDTSPQPPVSIANSSTARQETKRNCCDAKEQAWDWNDAIAPPTWSSWALVLVGVGAIGAAIFTLMAINRQAAVQEQELRVVNRAYIAPEWPESLSTIGFFRFRIRFNNHGHIIAKVNTVSVETIVQDFHTGKELFRHDEKKNVNKVIPPQRNDIYAIYVNLPLEYIDEICIVSVGVSYENGFNEADSLDFVRVHSGQNRIWMMGSEADDFDYRNVEHKEGKDKNPN
jgi:hypothetical protein